jgi:tRNA pseudouridine55 synthase
MTLSATQRTWEFNGTGEILLVDKPLDWTSMDVVKKVRSLFHVSKVGHAGTLDPKATGLLIVCTGERTKEIDAFMMKEKEYTGAFQLGIRTPSFDLETEVVDRRELGGISPDRVAQVMADFVGFQTQVPPMYSAAKVGGKPLYTYARRGKTMPRTPKDIEVKVFRITKVDLPIVEFEVVCSKGTYVRSLVDDVGQRLGCGACLISLRRTRIGEYSVDNAAKMNELTELARLLSRERHQEHEVGFSS